MSLKLPYGKQIKGSMMKTLYSDKDAAFYLGVGASTIWLYTKQGKLDAIKLSPRVTRWTKQCLDDFIESRIGMNT